MQQTEKEALTLLHLEHEIVLSYLPYTQHAQLSILSTSNRIPTRGQ